MLVSSNGIPESVVQTEGIILLDIFAKIINYFFVHKISINGT